MNNQKIHFKVIETQIKPVQTKKKHKENQKNLEIQSSKRHAWQVYEDNALKVIISRTCLMKNIGWNKVAEMIKSYYDSNKIQYKTIRTGKQCRERWLYHLKKTGKSQWTSEEERKLYDLVKLKGRKWSELSVEMKKTDKEIKNHYYLSYRKRLRLIRKGLRSKGFDYDDEVKRIVESEAELYSIVRSRVEFWDLNEESVMKSICKYRLEGGSNKTLKNQSKQSDVKYKTVFSTLKTNLNKDFTCNRQVNVCIQSKLSNVSFLSSKRESFSNDDFNIDDSIRRFSLYNDRIFLCSIEKDRDTHKDKKNPMRQVRNSLNDNTDSTKNTNTINIIDEKDEKDVLFNQAQASNSVLISKHKEDENFFSSPVASGFNSSYSNFIVNLNENNEMEVGFNSKYSQFDYKNQINISKINEKYEFFNYFH